MPCTLDRTILAETFALGKAVAIEREAASTGEKIFLLDQHRRALVHRDISTETVITITGFLGAVLLLLGGVVFR